MITTKQLTRVLRIGAKAAESKAAWVAELRALRIGNSYSGDLRAMIEAWMIRKIHRFDRWVLWSTDIVNSLPCE